jgi:hypothetical protein|tara:strand:- start:1306 stop:1437 length:132 start_codon:yes stop_codon:yes gene_type:complete
MGRTPTFPPLVTHTPEMWVWLQVVKALWAEYEITEKVNLFLGI